MAEELPEATPKQAQALVEQGYQLLDVRTQEEWEEAHVSSATHIPLDQLQARVGEVSPDVVVMCRSGARSARAAGYLISSGHQAVNLDGGILAWEDDGLPVVSGA